MNRLTAIGIAALVLAGLASAAPEDNVITALNSYYQASVAEDVDSFMSYMELDCEENDCDAIAADITELWERVTTTSVKIHNPKVIIGDDDAAVSYNITAKFLVHSDNGKSYNFTQGYELMAYMIKSKDSKWRVAYIIPTVFYEEAEVNMGALPLLVDMALEGEKTAGELDIRGQLTSTQDNTLLIAVIILAVAAIVFLYLRFVRRRKNPMPAAKTGVYCPKCGTVNYSDSKFCQKCGREL